MGSAAWAQDPFGEDGTNAAEATGGSNVDQDPLNPQPVGDCPPVKSPSDHLGCKQYRRFCSSKIKDVCEILPGYYVRVLCDTRPLEDESMVPHFELRSMEDCAQLCRDYAVRNGTCRSSHWKQADGACYLNDGIKSTEHAPGYVHLLPERKCEREGRECREELAKWDNGEFACPAGQWKTKLLNGKKFLTLCMVVIAGIPSARYKPTLEECAYTCASEGCNGVTFNRETFECYFSTSVFDEATSIRRDVRYDTVFRLD
ncbi:hypothetical protein BDV25DRAFT_138837 [Aspergillus avenaceus]|uniref:Apple domain-containing protein n=1 Tax=Aspergillus avenaceus TaxID=36643 RepID=A0A5N6TYT1_ASPAV|nr:hypothetical protein BDV25DRAFT_138837 [Aspergillus avenaceus]